MQINADPPPFWSPPPPPPNTSMPRRRSSSSSPLLSSPLLIILLPIIFLVFLFITIPPLLSFTFHILRPTYSVKKSWDSFNIVLVMIAILCGIFARKNDDGSTSNVSSNTSTNDTNKTTHEEEPTSQQQQQQQQWFQYSERKISDYDDPDPSRIWSPATGVTRLKRSSSSYPDLRQQDSTWERDADDHRFRFFDDFEINNFNYNYNHNPVRPRSFGQEQEEEDVEVKEIPVDTFEIRSSPAPPKSPAPPPPPPLPPPQPKRTYETVGRKEKAKQNDTQFKEVKEKEKNICRTPPPAPPPPPSPASVRSEEQKYVKSGRKKSNVKKEIKMVLASIYKQRKRNKKKRKDPYDESLPSEADRAYSTRPLPSPPPPPPPPPPPSVFHSFFKKGLIKSKKVHSVSVSAPPPPPPPPPPSTSTSSRKKTRVPPELHRRPSSATIGKPPLPTRVTNWDKSESVNVGVGVNSGEQSPSIPMPPPPPPLMPDMRFVVRGDFVKIRSAHSSRCGSPELEDVDGSSSVSVMDGGDGVVAGAGAGVSVGGSVFCPSPDVNIKADSFIARLHDGWRLEKVNSLREKQKMG